ncbi:MAG: hypothetical protein ACK5KU_03345 [Beutenbergiaceae bacterium]
MQRRNWIVAGGVGGALVVALVVAAQFSTDEPDPQVQQSADSDGASSAAEPTDEPAGDASQSPAPAPVIVVTPTPGPLADLDVEVARVSESVQSVVDAGNEISQRGDGGTEGLELIATGFVLGEMQNQAREQAEQGLQQSGEATVVSSEMIASDLDATPATMTIAVCVDVSDLALTDMNGVDVSERLYNPGHPVRHLYGALYEDDAWLIASHEIPDEQGCEV